MLSVLALAAVLNSDSVVVNEVYALKNLDSVLTANQVILTDTPRVVIQTNDVSMETLKEAFQFARLYLQGKLAEAGALPGYENAEVVATYPALKKKKVYALLRHDDGNLPEVIFENTGDLGALEITYITRDGMVIAVAKL